MLNINEGSYDVSLINIEDEVYEVKAVRGDSSWGGFEFCKQMIEHWVKEIYTQLEMDISNNKQALRNLNSKCHKALINTVDSN